MGSEANPQWVWAALDADTRQVVAVVAGDRSGATAGALWDAPPAGSRRAAAGRTDFWAAYAAAVPAARREPGGKGDGVTCHVGRFWRTLRQRSARLVRQTLSFSKCWDNHIGALWYFARLDNQSQL